MEVFSNVELVRTCIVAAAYIPSIRHLIKEHCPAGISIRPIALGSSARGRTRDRKVIYAEPCAKVVGLPCRKIKRRMLSNQCPGVLTT